jgi:hypothetical protein
MRPMTIPDMMYCERSVESMVIPPFSRNKFGNEKMKGMEWGVACLSIPLIQSSPLH